MPEQQQQETQKWQTFSNRDYLNKIFIDKYEMAIGYLMETLAADPKETRKQNLEARELMFKKSLASLYWSFIVPRLSLFEKEEKELDDIKRKYKVSILASAEINKTGFEKTTVMDGTQLLAIIAEYMYFLGVIRPEKKEADLAHVAMEEIET